MHKAEEYLKKNQLFFNKSMNYEIDNRGLIIKEAYFGLSEHIYHIDAGVITYAIPQTIEEYEKLQVIPVTKQMQILVKDSKLEIS